MNNTKIPSAVSLCLLTLLISACAGTGATVSNDNSTDTLPPRPSGIVLVREYVDTNKIDGADVYTKVSYSWDYGAGMALVETSTMEGKLITRVHEAGLTLKGTDAEMARAYALVKRHPVLGPRVARADAHFYGGFSYVDVGNPICGAKTRCMHVIVSAGPNGSTTLVHSIIDLSSDTVAIPIFAPLETGDAVAPAQ